MLVMKRRDFVTIVSSALLGSSLAPRAQQTSKAPTVSRAWSRSSAWQAVGPPRGGRHAKIRALAVVKGRFSAILWPGGDAHDCPVAERPQGEAGERDAGRHSCAGGSARPAISVAR